MDYGKIIGDSFEYTKEGLLGNISTWILLIILTLLPIIPFVLAVVVMLPSIMAGTLPDITTLIVVFGAAFLIAIALSAFYQGYLIKILRGDSPLPAVGGYGTLFADGIKYIAIEIVFFLPVIVFLAVTLGSALFAALSAGPDWNDLLPIFSTVMLSVFVAVVIALIISLFALIGVIRFARTGSMGEAFNFGAILETIRKIGWGTYILALVIGFAIVFLVQIVLGVIPYLGGILQLIISPFISVFFTRYIALLYESGESSGSVSSPLPVPE